MPQYHPVRTAAIRTATGELDVERLDGDNGAGLKRLMGLLENVPQPVDHMLGSSILEAEDDDAHDTPLAQRDNLSEVKVERQNDAVFRNRLGEDVLVG